MGFKATVNKFGVDMNLYFTIISTEDNKFEPCESGTGQTHVLVRGFESRERLYEKIANPTDEENIIAFECRYTMPIVDVDSGKWEQVYAWLKENHFPDAVDVIE